MVKEELLFQHLVQTNVHIDFIVEENPGLFSHTSNDGRVAVEAKFEDWVDLSHLENEKPDQEVHLTQPVAVLFLLALLRALLLGVHWGHMQ